MLDMRKLQKMLKNVDIEEIDAVRVIIETVKEKIVIEKPKVVRTGFMGQSVFQVIGGNVRKESQDHESEKVKKGEYKVNESDAKLVAEQANVDIAEAKEALIKADGDIAKAIMILRRGE